VQLLFHARNGLLTTNPVLVLSLAGAVRIVWSPHRRELALLALICLAQLLCVAKYDQWFQSHFSNRFLMTTVALAVFARLVLEPVVRVLERRRLPQDAGH